MLRQNILAKKNWTEEKYCVALTFRFAVTIVIFGNI